MKGLIEEYGRIILSAFIGIIIITGFYLMLNTNFLDATQQQVESYKQPVLDTNIDYTEIPHPQLTLNDSIKINQNDYFDIISSPSVMAKEANTGLDITDNVLVFGEISGQKYDGDWKSNRKIKAEIPGVYKLRYSLRDSNGLYITKCVKIIVEEII